MIQTTQNPKRELFEKQISVSNLDFSDNELKRSQDDSYESGKYGKEKPPVEIASPSRERSFSLSENKRDSKRRKSRLEEALDDLMQKAVDKGSTIRNVLTPGGSQRVLVTMPNKAQKSFLDSDLLTQDNKPTALGSHDHPSGSKKTSTMLHEQSKPRNPAWLGSRKLSQRSLPSVEDKKQKSTLVSPHSTVLGTVLQATIKAHIPKVVRSTSQAHLLKVLGAVSPQQATNSANFGVLGRIELQSTRSQLPPQLPTLGGSTSWAGMKQRPLRVQNRSESIKNLYEASS